MIGLSTVEIICDIRGGVTPQGVFKTQLATSLHILHDNVVSLQKGLGWFEPTTLKVSLSNVVIRTLCFFCTNCGIPVTLLRSGGVSSTAQLGGVSYLMRTISFIVFSSQKLTFTSLVLQKKSIYLPRGRIYVRIKQLYAQFKLSLPPSRFGSDKIVKFLCNQSWITPTMRGEV